MGKSCIIVAFMLLLMIHPSICLMKCKKDELEALFKFKHSFTEDPMNRLSSWVGDDCCHWLGVTCDNVTGSVIKLNLRSNPTYENPFRPLVSSYLSSALLELEFLTHLDLSYNSFNLSQIPKFIGSMSNLRYLNLSSAGFSGPIPQEFGNLINLIHLDLSSSIDHMLQERVDWAYGLSKLQSLDMGGINLSQVNNILQVLIRLPSLIVLGLQDCHLNDTHLPKIHITNSSITVSSTLQHLDLSINYFEGPFPRFLKNMVSLRSLSLSNNNGLNGSVPLWLRNMKHLEFLDLSWNSFTNVEGGIWGIMGNPCNFKHIDLSQNSIIQEDILKPFSNSSRCAAYDLEYLSLHRNNKLNGSVPSLLGQLTKLKYLDLSYNWFEGRVPASLSKLSAVEYFDLSMNRLTGVIPDVLKHLTKVEHLDISLNSMQGSLSGLSNLSKLSYLDMNFNNLNLTKSFNCRPRFQLEVFRVHSCGINTVFPQWLRNQTQIYELDLSNTSISGELPGWLLNMTYLTWVQISDNQLTGSLPQHIACDGCNLNVLELYNNMLSGTIPRWLAHLKTTVAIDLSNNWLSGKIFEGENTSSLLAGRNSLAVLDLSDNMFSGEIQIKNVYPSTFMQILSLRGNDFSGPISSQLCHFPKLVMLELAHNRFTGHIPRCLGALLFDRGNSLYDSISYAFQILEAIKGTTQKFSGTGVVHSMIDLSSNRLVGVIPKEFTNISKLTELNLSNNHLTGGIPGMIGHLQMLESLDLSNNNLSGTIPQSLSDIPWLSVLNLSNNHLHGPIPTGNQLQTLVNPSIYAGNPGLCGSPLLNKCNKLDSTPTPADNVPGAGEQDDTEDKHEKMWLYLVIMSGVAAGFWGVIGTLVFKKTWRHSYFRFVEETGDKIYVPFRVRVNRCKNSRQRKKAVAESSCERCIKIKTGNTTK